MGLRFRSLKSSAVWIYDNINNSSLKGLIKAYKKRGGVNRRFKGMLWGLWALMQRFNGACVVICSGCPISLIYFD